MHINQTVTAKWLIEHGASVNDDDFTTTESPTRIAKTMENMLLDKIIKQKEDEIDALKLHINQFFEVFPQTESEVNEK